MPAMLFLRLSEEHRAHGALLQELLQRHSTGLDAQHRALLVPVAQHDAPARTITEGEIVEGRPVRVAVDQRIDAELRQRRLHG